MPLSEHEQRLLEQMERQLYADDPKLASTLRGSGRSLRSRHQVVLGVLGILAGLGLLVAGVATQVWVLGVAGFLVMLAGGWWASTRWNSSGSAPSAGAGRSGGRAAGPRKSGFMNRIEERWERRREGDL